MHRSIRLGFSNLYKTNKQQQQTNKQTKTVSSREHETKETDHTTHHEGPLFLYYVPCATFPESRAQFLTSLLKSVLSADGRVWTNADSSLLEQHVFFPSEMVFTRC